ncbi:hypothetical protein J6590_097248 [Homalodisca vitripennis]|nr:hypothetical protein J6590_097248 [Homalodisca vitripennis]
MRPREDRRHERDRDRELVWRGRVGRKGYVNESCLPTTATSTVMDNGCHLELADCVRCSHASGAVPRASVDMSGRFTDVLNYDVVLNHYDCSTFGEASKSSKKRMGSDTTRESNAAA